MLYDDDGGGGVAMVMVTGYGSKGRENTRNKSIKCSYTPILTIYEKIGELFFVIVLLSRVLCKIAKVFCVFLFSLGFRSIVRFQQAARISID